MKFKESIEFFIICYIFCLITKIAINKLIFNSVYLLDALYISLGCTIGYFIGISLRKK